MKKFFISIVLSATVIGLLLPFNCFGAKHVTILYTGDIGGKITSVAG